MQRSQRISERTFQEELIRNKVQNIFEVLGGRCVSRGVTQRESINRGLRGRVGGQEQWQSDHVGSLALIEMWI